MSCAENLTGQRFGRLTVIGDEGIREKSGIVKWKCLCDCGNTCFVRGYSLRSGNTKSCGCLSVEKAHLSKNKKHGETRTRLHVIWKNMRERCYNPNATSYHNYGAKGITVCDEWNDYKTFRDWAYSSGYKNDLTIDRIDTTKGYSPENCRWADYTTQSRNRTICKKYEWQGKELTIPEIAEITRLEVSTIRARIKRGWDIEKTINTPLLSGAKTS